MSITRKSIVWGVFYTALSKYSGILLSIIIGAILARLLTPEEFGVVAIVMVFVSFFNLFSSFGIGPAVVQNQGLTVEDIESIFAFSIVLGFIFSAIFFLAAPLIAEFYDMQVLVNVSRLLSLSIFFYSIQVVPLALIQKKLRFKKLALVNVFIQLFSGSLAIFFAYKGFKYYALVYKSIFDGLATFVSFYWLAPVKPVFRIKTDSIFKISKFSTFQFLFNFINYFSRNLDNLLIGKYFGSAALGFYDRSYRLMMIPVANLTHVITPVLLPVLSQFQNENNKIFLSYMKLVKILATIGFPLSIFLFFSASEIINIIYGPQWEESIPVFKLLALTVGFQMLLSSTGTIFQAVNKTNMLFYSGLLSAVLMVSGISYGVFFGGNLETVGLGLLSAFTINFFLGFYILIELALGCRFITFLKSLIFPLILTLGVWLSLYIVNLYPASNEYYSLLVNTSTAILSFGIIFLSVEENRESLKTVAKEHWKY